MPKLTDAKELETFENTVARHIDGVTIRDIEGLFAPKQSRRTLQRRLDALISEGRIEARGRGRATRYFATLEAAPRYELPWRASSPHVAEPPPPPYASSPSLPASKDAVAPNASALGKAAYVKTSPEGEEVRAYVHQSKQARKPIGYQLSFLEAYQPNATFYLPQSLRDQLFVLGRSPTADTPAGTFAKDILNRLLIDLSWASSQLEGNTYSRLDTERLIQFGQAAAGKDAFETQMILNHKSAIEYLVLDPARAPVSVETIIALHALLSDGLMADPLACGRIRQRAVDIGGSVYLPLAFPQQLEEIFGYVMQMAAEIADPFEQSFFLMVHLPYLQPFEDVNKRVSRLAANIPFVQRNLCPLSFIDVSPEAYVDGILGVYELNRIELLRDVFISAYERSCQQYVAVKQQLVPPDTFRLRHRDALNQTMAAMVRARARPGERAIAAHIPERVPEDERERFVSLVLKEFESLHAGNAVRFGLRPLEYEDWKKNKT
ncbi:MAG: Fic family protein [Betaproteobacteria bacterium]|nr:MAG: Fic family protein [Betaproteobacteria bacterium]